MLDGAKILCETWQGIDIEGNACTNVMMPLYDNEDSVCGILYNGTPYYFLKNLQGDIIAITDQEGTTVAQYSYDAWGVCTVAEDTSDSNIATINPFRYRGYYYDSEIGMCYLQSRHFDSVCGRFLNSDYVELAITERTITKCNPFTYCFNDPTNFNDANGTDAVWLQASKSVCGMGHTGLLFEYKGSWYYWYWGLVPDSAISGYLQSLADALLNGRMLWGTLRHVAYTTVKAKAMLKKINNKISIGNYKRIALEVANKLYESKTKFDKVFYIKGNFKGSYSHFSLLTKTLNYNLLARNCMQTTADGLKKGTFSKSKTLNRLRMKIARDLIVPNFAYEFLKSYF